MVPLTTVAQGLVVVDTVHVVTSSSWETEVVSDVVEVVVPVEVVVTPHAVVRV